MAYFLINCVNDLHMLAAGRSIDGSNIYKPRSAAVPRHGSSLPTEDRVRMLVLTLQTKSNVTVFHLKVAPTPPLPLFSRKINCDSSCRSSAERQDAVNVRIRAKSHLQARGL